MRKLLLSITVVPFLLFSCKKDSAHSPGTDARFSVGYISETGFGYGGAGDSSVFLTGTHDKWNLINQSTNAEAVSWEFWKGRTSNEEHPLLPTDSAGTYNVTLTAYNNRSGKKSVASKKIVVLDRVLKSVSINNLELNKFLPHLTHKPVFRKADLWIAIKYSQQKDSISSDGDVLAPVIFTSPVFAEVDSGYHGSLTFMLPASSKVIINYPVNGFNYPLNGRGTIVNLYAKDNSGSYLLASSWWYTSGGLQFFSGGADPYHRKHYTVGYSIILSKTSISIDCAYE